MWNPAWLRWLAPERAPFGGRLVVAVSGGGDSLALLVGLVRAGWAPERLLAVGIDHGLRGAARSELEHAARVARRFGVPWRDERLTWERRPNAERLRAARRAALEDVRRATGAAAIALGHTADDQRETRWLALARGAGLRGLAGMRPWRPPWWRPLLEVPRAELRRFLVAEGLRWCEDPSNLDFRHERARIRHLLLPSLGRPWTPAEALRVRLLQEEDRFLDALAREQAADDLRGPLLARRAVVEASPVLARRLLRCWLDALPGPTVAAERIEALRSTAIRPPNRLRQIELHGRGVVLIGARWLVATVGIPKRVRWCGELQWGAFGRLSWDGAEPVLVQRGVAREFLPGAPAELRAVVPRVERPEGRWVPWPLERPARWRTTEGVLTWVPAPELGNAR